MPLFGPLFASFADENIFFKLPKSRSVVNADFAAAMPFPILSSTTEAAFLMPSVTLATADGGAAFCGCGTTGFAATGGAATGFAATGNGSC